MSQEPLEIAIDPAFAELPLLDWLAVLWPDRSKEGLRALFARGGVRSAGRPVSPAARAGGAARVAFHADPRELPSIYLDPREAESGARVLHRDGRLAAVEKPAGVPVIPDRSRSGPSVLGFLIRMEMEERAGKAAADFRRDRVVHRIDRQTSGVVVLARTLADEVRLAGMFERGEVRKEYLALLAGEVLPALASVDVPVGPGRKGKMRAGPAGKPSLTDFEVLERLGGFTLVRALPRTGRTHQIRVHALALGHPLAVDPLYRVGARAADPLPPGIGRLTLHAERLVLPEAWGEPREFRAGLPADFRASLDALRLSGAGGPPGAR